MSKKITELTAATALERADDSVIARSGDNYKVPMSLLGDGSTLTIAANDATTRAKARADYLCDGTADDVQIQAAIDALTIGGRVLLSEGTFTLSDSITIQGTNNLYLGGMGTSTILKLADNLAVSTVLSLITANSIIIENLKVDSNGSNQTGSAYNILADQVKDLIINNVFLTNARAHSIGLINNAGDPCQNIVITGCTVEEFDINDASNDGISIGDDQFNVSIRSCIIRHSSKGTAARSGIEIEDGAHNVAITGCVIYGMENGVNMHVHSSEPAVYGVTVQACTIYDTTVGIRLAGDASANIYGAILSDNICHSNVNGIQLIRAKCSMISNALFSNTGYGITIYQCDYCTISSCWIWSNGESGISLNQSNYNTIADSIIYENTKRGIVMQGSTTGSNRCVLSNNQIIDNDNGNSNNYPGIQVSAASHNNLFQGNGFYVTSTGTKQTYGISVVAGATGNIIMDNQMTQGGRTAALNDAGTNTIIRGNIGYLTENEGATAGVADGDTIAHGLAGTPTVTVVSPSVASEMISVTALAGTDFTVAIKDDAGSAGTSQTIYWRAWI